MAMWQAEASSSSLGLDDVPHLFSRDGPWRGNFEDACYYTRNRAGRPAVQAQALTLLICCVWHFYLAYVDHDVQATLILALVHLLILCATSRHLNDITCDL